MNLASRLLAADTLSPDVVALWWRDETVTYGELRDQAARLAGGLRHLGVATGDRVGIVCANNPYFVVSYLGVLATGAVAVPVNPSSPPEEMARELAGTGAGVAVVGPAGSVAVRRALDEGLLAGVTVVAAGTPAGESPDGAVLFEGLLEGDAVETVERDASDVAVLAHTSGTSGPSRAAMLTHGSLAANLDQAQRHPTMRVEPTDVVLGVLPLFHSYGLNGVLGLALSAGVPLLLAERFDPAGTAELVGLRRVTVLPGVPPMFAAWLAMPGLAADAFASVRVAVSGAAPLDADVQRRFREHFGVPLHQGYGLTEASPIVTTTGVEGEPRPGTIGVPLPGVEVRLIDSQGGDALVGDPGEIWVRGPNVFAGYWHDEAATRRVLTDDGWLKTGDVAVAGDDGHLTIVDRSKDLIIVSGFNVYPAEVEEVLVRHEGVAEAAVVGVPHPHTGEAVKAFVVPERSGGGEGGEGPGAGGAVQLDETELIDFTGRFLARYKCPVAVEVVDELPRGLAGKILRRALEVPGTPDAPETVSDA